MIVVLVAVAFVVEAVAPLATATGTATATATAPPATPIPGPPAISLASPSVVVCRRVVQRREFAMPAFAPAAPSRLRSAMRRTSCAGSVAPPIRCSRGGGLP